MNLRIPVSILAACLTLSAEGAIKDETYNMPVAVVAEMGVEAAMKKMETAVTPQSLDLFKKAHPAPFWLFGEDRQFAVRNNIAPAHWFEDGAKQFGKFSGVARPGEFYVFQVCMVPGEEKRAFDSGVVFDSLKGAEATILSSIDSSMSEEGEHRLSSLSSDAVKPIWIGLQIPENAPPGIYTGRVQFRTSRHRSEIDPILGGDKHALFPESLTFSIKVEGEPLKESGTGEAWRLASLKWLNSEIGESETEVTRPFTPIRVGAATRTLGILGRNITLGESGVPAQFTSFFSESNTRILDKGRNAFAAAPHFEVVANGKVVELKPAGFKFTKQTPVGVEWEAVNNSGDWCLLVKGRLEFDGNLSLAMTLTNESKDDVRRIEGTPVDDIRFVVPWQKDTAKYAMGLGLKGGLAPEKLDWKWDVLKHQDAIWLGDTNIGTMFRFKGANYRRPLINAYYAFQLLNLPDSWGSGGVKFENNSLTAYSGPKNVRTMGKGEGALQFNNNTRSRSTGGYGMAVIYKSWKGHEDERLKI